MVRIVSWNVNGLRAVINKEKLKCIHDLKPDILCLQEIKAQKDQVDDAVLKEEFAGLNKIYWNSALRKGYSGNLIAMRPSLAKKIKGEPISTLGIKEFDDEGRFLGVDFGAVQVASIYSPNVKHDLSRLSGRTDVFDDALAKYIKSAHKKNKAMVLCGDFNVAREEIDLARPKANRGNAGFTDEERSAFEKILAQKMSDSFRLFTTDSGHYTWWSFRSGARERNVGWRIDYILVSDSIKDKVKTGLIHPEIMGSDHCPISIDIIGI